MDKGPLFNKRKDKITHLSNVHSTRWLEPIIANGLGLLLQKVQQLILLDTLLSNTPHNPELLLQAHPINNIFQQSRSISQFSKLKLYLEKKKEKKNSNQFINQHIKKCIPKDCVYASNVFICNFLIIRCNSNHF